MIKKYILFTVLFSLLLLNSLLAQSPPVRQASAVLNLTDTLSQIGGELRWDPFFESGVFSFQGFNAAFFSSQRGEEGPVLFNNSEVLELPLPYSDAGELFFPEAFVAGVTQSFRRYAEEERSRFRIAAVVIDPGHGGRDPGAIGNHTINGTQLRSVEKDIVLNVSRLLHASLTASYPDKRILLTREGDTYPSLDDRVNMANNITVKDNEAIIYISIHANASLANPNARGYEVWYLPPTFRRNLLTQSNFTGSPEVMTIFNDMLQEEISTESILLARNILSQFDRLLGDTMPSRGLKEEAWFVVRNAYMPSVLVELGFVSNRTDALLMNDDSHLQKFSEALYNGIVDFINTFEGAGFSAQF